MPKRIEFVQGEYYHIYNRGAGRQAIFFEERNYRYLLRLLKAVAAECQLAVIAYALIPNHYHWLVRQDGETPAGRVPARVFGGYSQAVNRAYDVCGTLFEGPYKAQHVGTDAYFLHLCAYMHRNPVHHGLVAAPEDWPYANTWSGSKSDRGRLSTGSASRAMLRRLRSMWITSRDMGSGTPSRKLAASWKGNDLAGPVMESGAAQSLTAARDTNQVRAGSPTLSRPKGWTAPPPLWWPSCERANLLSLPTGAGLGTTPRPPNRVIPPGRVVFGRLA